MTYITNLVHGNDVVRQSATPPLAFAAAARVHDLLDSSVVVVVSVVVVLVVVVVVVVVVVTISIHAAESEAFEENKH